MEYSPAGKILTSKRFGMKRKAEGFGMMGRNIVRFNKPETAKRLVLSKAEFAAFKKHCRECHMTNEEFREVMRLFSIQIVYERVRPSKAVQTM